MTDQPELLDCGHALVRGSPHETGYGYDKEGKRHCYDCCAAQERQAMIDTGVAVLYLVRVSTAPPRFKVTDWAGRLAFKVHRWHTGHHNLARVREDVWFDGPDGHVWHGTLYGRNTQLCRCRRTRIKARPAV